MAIVRLSPDKYMIRDTEVAHHFSRELGCECVTYFFPETEQWILAVWLDRDKGLVEELEDLGTNFELLDRALAQKIKRGWGRRDVKEYKKQLMRRRAHRIFAKNEAIAADQERYDWLKKKTGEPIPYAFKAPT